MAARAMLVLFAQALLIQSALSQNCGRLYTPAAYSLSTPFGYDGFSTFPGRLAGNSLTYNGLSNSIINGPAVEIIPTSGGALPVTSASPIAPNSIVVASENVYEGTLAVAGELPFVGSVGIEGDLPTIGSGAVNHACGNGAIGMISQDALVNNIGTGYVASAFGNMCGNIGGFSNPVVASPFPYNAGYAGDSYPATGLAGSYPAIGYSSGLASDVMGPTYDGIAYPAAGLAGAGLAGPFGLASGLGYDGLAYPGAASYGSGVAAYGGAGEGNVAVAGEGNVAVAGELPVAGNTALYGQVPIMGAVSFSGPVAASGAVTITGKCGCGCGYQYLY